MSGIAITASDLVKVIKACGESNVLELEWESVKLKFYNSDHHNQNQIIASSQEVISGLNEVDQTGQPHSLMNDYHFSDSSAYTEDMLAQMAIEDPVAYEELNQRKLMEG